MFPQNMYSGPGRKKKLSGGMIVFLVVLLILQGMIIVYALMMAFRTRLHVIWLDPYLQISIQGADGYAVAEPVFDEDVFRSDFEEILLQTDSSLRPENAASLSEKAAGSLIYEFHVKAADGETDVNISDADEEDDEINQQEDYELPVPGISNGDTVTLYADISEEAWTELRDKGFFLSFECNPVVQTAEGLPEAEPYDPFGELTVLFSGLNGAGTIELYYNGYYPFSFSADPSEGLSNGDQVKVSMSFNEGYDLNRIVEEYHIMPVSLSGQYTVSGLYANPSGIDSFTQENRDALMQHGREAVNALLEEEYEDGEMFVIDDAGMYFAVSNEGAEEAAGSRNYLFCVYLINYTNESGDDLQYYYYVRFEDLMLDESGQVIADFTHYDYPKKPSIPLIGEALGDGSQVSVPGILNFRTLAGYESLEELITRAITPLESAYTVTSIEQ